MDSSKSLQQLEGEDWGGPGGAPTNMVRRCLELGGNAENGQYCTLSS